MLDFTSRRFTVRLGRSNKSGLVSGEQVNKRFSVVGRKTSARRVSVRKSTTLRRAPSGAGGPQRGTSVRRTPSGVRRGASVRRAPSSARRNSKRTSIYVDGIHPASSFLSPSTETNPATILQPTALLTPSSAQPASSPEAPKSFLSKLANRFRGRSRKQHTHAQAVSGSSAIAATFSATNLSPVGFVPPRSPSLRSPSPGSRVTFVDTPIQPNGTSDAPVGDVVVQARINRGAEKHQDSECAQPEEIVDEGDEAAGEWVDAEDDGPDPEPHIAPPTNKDSIIDSAHASTMTVQPAVPKHASEAQISQNAPALDPTTGSEETAKDEPEVVHFQADLLSDLARQRIGVDARVSQWLAVTPVVDEEFKEDGDVCAMLDAGTDGVETLLAPKVETRRRPPHIIVPSPTPTLSSNNPFRVPLPPSPSPSSIASALPETNPFRSLVSTQSGLTAETISPEGPAPPSPSIFLTPATHHDEFLDVPRKSEELLTVDSTQFPLPPSPSPSYVSLPQTDDASRCPSPPTTTASVARSGSVSTSGGRSLSTAPSTRGPATPTSARIPGHPAFAHFSFGGPRSPSLKIEDWEEGEEERRGRSLEVSGNKRRMRSTSPGLDAVLEGDESHRSSKASIEGLERKTSPELKQPLSPLPVVEEATAFGRKGGDDTDSEHEDEDGFFAFAEQQLERQKKVVETRQLEAPKRSKTMSFLGFGKRKSTMGDSVVMPAPAMSRSATSSGLLSPPLSAPKRSSTLATPVAESSNRLSRLPAGQRSSTMMTPVEPRMALSPTMYTVGDIHAETGKIEDDESRRLSEAVFMF